MTIITDEEKEGGRVDNQVSFNADGGLLPPREQCDFIGHCWHVSGEQHTIDRHRDDGCCYCGAHRCVSVDRPVRDGRGGHGLFRGQGEMVRDGE